MFCRISFYSDLDSKQKTETEVTVCSVLMDFILVRAGFQTENRNRGLYQSHLKYDRLWPIVTDCDRLWPKPVLLKKTFENRSDRFQTMWPIVTDCDRHKCHICDLRLEWLVQIPFLFAFGIRLRLALRLVIRIGLSRRYVSFCLFVLTTVFLVQSILNINKELATRN